MTGDFAAIGLTLYVAHHVGDYWIQRDIDAKHKGDRTTAGSWHCLLHVLSYVATQSVLLTVLRWTIDVRIGTLAGLAGLAFSGAAHYFADRRYPLIWLASKLPGKAKFLELGKPRAGMGDNPQLATGAWALDQSWHILTSVFITALIMVTL